MAHQQCYFCNASISSSEQVCPHCSSPLMLKNRYRLLRTLGQGGFGVVYEAIDMQQAQRLCAIKRVAFASLAEKQQIENEAHILQQSAPLFRFVPDLYDFWSDATNTFLVMECIEGPTLDQTSLPWPPGKVEQFLRTLLNYLENLHATSTIHRDLKPWNIKQTPQGRYVLLDFGIAKQGNGTLTNARGIGTVNYAPPEQVHGQPTDERSDLYSLAATAYSLLTDQSPLQARMQAGGILPSPAHLVAGVSPRLEQTIMRMLESEPANRPQNAREALKLLDGNGEELATIRLTDASHSNQPTASSISPPIGSTAPAGATSATPAAPAAYPLAPPMPANPSAATLRSPPLTPQSAAQPAASAHQTAAGSIRGRRLSWVVLLFVALLLVGGSGAWWFHAVRSQTSPLPPLHAPTSVARNILSETSRASAPTRPVVSPTPATPTMAAGLSQSQQQTAALLDTRTASQAQTQTAVAQDAATINSLWEDYDQAAGQSDWEGMLLALDTIIGMTGSTPDSQEYPAPPFDARTLDIANIRADARLRYGVVLQQAGKLDAAQAQYQAVQSETGVAQKFRNRAVVALDMLEQARGWWEQVNAAWDVQDWNAALQALYALQELEGFGEQARDPQDGYTVAELIEMATRFLNSSQPQPSETAQTQPTVTPSATPLLPTATPTPQPTRQTIIPKTIVPIATVIPTPPPPTFILIPTMAPSPFPTGGLSPQPTSTTPRPTSNSPTAPTPRENTSPVSTASTASPQTAIVPPVSTRVASPQATDDTQTVLTVTSIAYP